MEDWIRIYPTRMALMVLLLLTAVAALTVATPSVSFRDATAVDLAPLVDQDELWWRAIALYNQKQFGASSALFQQLAAHHRGAPNASIEIALGSSYHSQEKYELAQVHYERALALRPRDAVVLANIGFLYYDTKRYARAIDFFERAIDIDPSKEFVIVHSLAIAYHNTADYARAEALFEHVPPSRRTAQYHYDRAVTLERQGKILEAGAAYNSAIEMDQQFAYAWHNIAALHQLYGEPSEAIRCYLEVLRITSAPLELRLMTTTNLGIAFEMTDDVRSALLYYSRAHELTKESNASQDEAVQLRAHVARAKRTACLWDTFESDHDVLVAYVRDQQLPRGVRTSLQPFDTLLVTMDARLRLAVARAHSAPIERAAAAIFDSLPVSHHYERSPSGARLRVGYVSYDFTDHPTAHLLEGVFAAQDRRTIEAIAFGYGKDDGSAFRARLLQLVDEFVNLASVATTDGVHELRARGLDIFMDAQGHTRGARAQLTAARPAPIVVNYLVYPGTSGAAFVDYVVSDRRVTPPDTLASHFSEKLVLLPHSYQVNYYPEAVVPHGRASLWGPDDQTQANDGWFTFVNFNKIDKLEPAAFSLWMAILRRVPRSRLLLLDPTRATGRTSTAREIVSNLRLEAAAHGVAGSRISFVPRVDKRDHLRRHRQGGLFLDTLVYGAHSTATDALYAGLPVLTLAGDAFANRVGVSLLHNVDLPELVTHSRKEFEDLAVAIATEPEPLLVRLHERLRTPDDHVPRLFRTREHVATLEAAQRVMATLHRSVSRALATPTASASSTTTGTTLPRTAHIIIV